MQTLKVFSVISYIKAFLSLWRSMRYKLIYTFSNFLCKIKYHCICALCVFVKTEILDSCNSLSTLMTKTAGFSLYFSHINIIGTPYSWLFSDFLLFYTSNIFLSKSFYLSIYLKFLYTPIYIFFVFVFFFVLFWLCWVFIAVCGLSLIAASGACSSLQCMGSRCAGFSSCGTQAQ